MLPKPAVVVFNIENTLAASFQALTAACRQLCHGVYGDHLAQVDPLALASSIERNRVWFWSDPKRAARAQHDIHGARGEFVCRAMIQIGLDCVEITESFAHDCFRLQRQLMRLFPHSEHILRQLNQAGIRHGIIYRSPDEPAHSVLREQDFRTFFEHIVGSEHTPADRRGGLVERCLELFQVDAADTCLVSNRLRSDVEPAVEMGLLSIWVNLPRSGQRPGDPLRPDHIISSTADLVPLLLERA
ncbi:MAG: HAD family hydrolase [Planctomycetota bacterium]